jgi:Predicted membrane protein
MYLYLWYFLVYAFLGWCTEVAYATVNTGKFINRGFLNGPVCPIYGFGVVLVISLLTPLKANILLLFLGSVVLTSTLEFLTGWILERLFSQTWWDYSDVPFNIGGYVCLKFSILWGIICVVVMSGIHPMVHSIVSFLDIRFGEIILAVLYSTLIVDGISTTQSIIRLNKQLKQINQLASLIRNVSDDIGERISNASMLIIEKTDELKTEITELKETTTEAIEERKTIATKVLEGQNEKLQQIVEKKKAQLYELNEKRAQIINKSFFGKQRILNAFPDMKSINYKEELEELKKKYLRKI